MPKTAVCAVEKHADRFLAQRAGVAVPAYRGVLKRLRVMAAGMRVCAFEAWYYDEADHDQDSANERIFELLLQAGGQPPDQAALEQWNERRDLDAYHRSDDYDYDD